jgi:hypothetical protein
VSTTIQRTVGRFTKQEAGKFSIEKLRGMSIFTKRIDQSLNLWTHINITKIQWWNYPFTMELVKKWLKNK